MVHGGRARHIACAVWRRALVCGVREGHLSAIRAVRRRDAAQFDRRLDQPLGVAARRALCSQVNRWMNASRKGCSGRGLACFYVLLRRLKADSVLASVSYMPLARY